MLLVDYHCNIQKLFAVTMPTSDLVTSIALAALSLYLSQLLSFTLPLSLSLSTIHSWGCCIPLCNASALSPSKTFSLPPPLSFSLSLCSLACNKCSPHDWVACNNRFEFEHNEQQHVAALQCRMQCSQLWHRQLALALRRGGSSSSTTAAAAVVIVVVVVARDARTHVWQL